MLRELSRMQRNTPSYKSATWESERVGRIVFINGNGLYTVDVDGLTYRNVPFTGSQEDDLFEGQSVRLMMQGGQPVILSSP